MLESQVKYIHHQRSLKYHSYNHLVTIEEISALPNNECVSVRVKVVVEDAIEVKKGLTKQDYWDCRCNWMLQNRCLGRQYIGLLNTSDSFKLSGLIGKRELANLVMQLARFFHIYIYIYATTLSHIS